jgi:ribosome-binding factor A
MSQIRMARMAEELREQVSDILRNHLSDPRLQWVSVVRVDLSPDLRHAKLFMSVLGSEADQETSLRVLARARGAIRAELAHRMRLRKVPEILFRADQTIAGSARILEILHELGFTGDSPAPIDEDGEA